MYIYSYRCECFSARRCVNMFEHVWAMWLRLAFHRRNERWKCTSNPTSAIARATFCPQLLDIPWHSLTFLDRPWHSLTLFSLVHLVQIELKPRRHDCPHRHFYRLRKGRCLRKQWVGARKAHHARVTIQSGEDESEVCEPQTANKFLRDWAFIFSLPAPIILVDLSCPTAAPSKMFWFIKHVPSDLIPCTLPGIKNAGDALQAALSDPWPNYSQSDCKSFMFVMTWSKQQKRLLKGNVVTVCYSMLPYIIKGSLGGETSVLRTFRMSGKELVKERASEGKS
jgi:hypothetical protein